MNNRTINDFPVGFDVLPHLDEGEGRIFCATTNPTEIVLAETEQGRGILGVVDGFPPKGVEDEGEIKWRKDFLTKIGYKL